MIFSWAMVIVEPISALMLASMVLRFRDPIGIHVFLRLWLAVLAAGLVIHAANHVDLLLNYKPPRTYSWVPIFAALNGAIWTAYLTERFRRKRKSNLMLFAGE